MNILMMTNTYLPHVGGVARSVESFTQAFRQRGHRVLIVAPTFENQEEDEQDVIRIPALQNFNGSDFSVVLPIPGILNSAIKGFEPDIVHVHHPFLIGSTAIRIASVFKLPLVFTHHTMYEQYTHYVPGNSEALQRFVIKLSTSYANLCDHIFAPSESIASVLRERKVDKPITVIPTGVDIAQYKQGSGQGFRKILQVSNRKFLVGHLGRLAPEKNLNFLAEAIKILMLQEPLVHFLLVGKGPLEASLQSFFADAGLSHRVHHIGILEQPILASAYKAMDVFAFASHSETQGMVLTEAMACGVPVVALDAPGVREVVEDYENGRLLGKVKATTFAEALLWIAHKSAAERNSLSYAALQTAENFSIDHSADQALNIYKSLLGSNYVHHSQEHNIWLDLLPLIKAEWELIKGYADAAGTLLAEDSSVAS